MERYQNENLVYIDNTFADSILPTSNQFITTGFRGGGSAFVAEAIIGFAYFSGHEFTALERAALYNIILSYFTNIGRATTVV